MFFGVGSNVADAKNKKYLRHVNQRTKIKCKDEENDKKKRGKKIILSNYVF